MKKFNDAVLLLRISHAINCLMYLCSIVLFGAFFILALNAKPTSKSSMRGFDSADQGVIIGIMAFFALMFVAILIAYIVGIIIAPKRTTANWVFQIVLSAFGATNIITIIPYLFAIMKLTEPDVKKYFEDKTLT